MKKNIDVVTVDSSFLEWLSAKVKTAPVEYESAKEFSQAVSNLIDGTTSSVMIETGASAERTVSERNITCGNLTIYANSRQVIRDGMEISLTPKEFDILYFLAKNRGEVFTKEQIYQAVWENDYLLDDSNIMAFIRKLRKKIEPDPDSPKYILTIWGIGYKFNDKIQ